MSQSQARQRRTVHFRGRVQGVGFRYTAVRIAGQFDVTGFVQNLPDGRVFVVVEGQPDEIDEFIDRLQSEMANYIRDSHVETCAANGEFDGFDVQY